jgi:hypothetical protein
MNVIFVIYSTCKGCVHKTQNGRTLPRTLRKRELRAPGWRAASLYSTCKAICLQINTTLHGILLGEYFTKIVISIFQIENLQAGLNVKLRGIN